MGGIRGVELARRGFSGPPTILEGRRGFMQAFANETRPEALVKDLGNRWEMMEAGIKPYANCGLIHAPIDALKALIDREGLVADDVEEIVVGCDRLSLNHVGKIGAFPTDTTGAQFSMEYSLAMQLVLGGAGFAEYFNAEEKKYQIPEVNEVAKKVRLELDPEADRLFPEKFFARVTVRRRDGSVLRNASYALGSPDAPVSEEQIRDKFRRTVGQVRGRSRAVAAERAVDQLFEGGPVGAVLRRLR
jgi:2-methylcitrate dehydratase PrpD